MEVRKERKRKRNNLPENEYSPKTQKIQNQAMTKWNIFIDKITQKPF